MFKWWWWYDDDDGEDEKPVLRSRSISTDWAAEDDETFATRIFFIAKVGSPLTPPPITIYVIIIIM